MTGPTGQGLAWQCMEPSFAMCKCGLLSQTCSQHRIWSAVPEGPEGPKGPFRPHRAKTQQSLDVGHPPNIEISKLYKFQPPGLNPHYISLGMGSVSGLLQVVLRVSERHPLICFAGNPRATLLLHLFTLQPLFAIDFLGLVEVNYLESLKSSGNPGSLARVASISSMCKLIIMYYHCLNR